jgi:hypothetical protein
MAKAKKSEEKSESKIEVVLPPIAVKQLTVDIAGKTPLIMDRFPEEVQKEILAKQTGISKSSKKKVRDTKKEIREAIHITSNGEIGFPAAGFKRGMMEVTSFVGDKFFSKKLVSGAVKIMNVVDGLVPIKYKKQDVLKHSIGHNMKFSPQFHDWSARLVIQYDGNNITPQDIITCLNYAGFYVGIGAWRPKCSKGGSGEYGMYTVKTSK